MRAAAVLPGVPVADEDRVKELPGPGSLVTTTEPVGGAGEAVAVGEDLDGHRERPSVWRHRQVRDTERKIRNCFGRATVRVQAPDL